MDNKSDRKLKERDYVTIHLFQVKLEFAPNCLSTKTEVPFKKVVLNIPTILLYANTKLGLKIFSKSV